MKVANYYPQENRLDLYGDNDILIRKFSGVLAHLNAVKIAATKRILLFMIIDSKLNKKANKIKEIA